MNQMMMNENNQNNGDNNMEQDQESNLLDGAISKVKAYIKKPDLVTSDTLNSLLQDLVDTKHYYSEEESSEIGEGNSMGESNGGKQGLAILIGVKKKGGQRQ